MGAESKLGLGIDIGTTFTAAAVALPDERVEALPLGESGPPVPTALFLQPPGLLVGEPAIRRGMSEPDSLTREFKRRFGDTSPVYLSGASYWVEYLYGILLEWVVGKASDHLGTRPDSVVVSHPAAWGQYKLELLLEACERAGIPEALTFSEPACVAFQYAAHASLPIGANIGVYDFGGGTFDAAVVRRTTSGFEIAGRPAGLEQAGGIDVDRAIFDLVFERVPELSEAVNAGSDDPGWESIVAHVRSACIDAKHGLSSDTVATVPVLLPSGHRAVQVTRAELEKSIRPLLDETITAFDRALDSADLPADQLHAIVLAGGSSRIPLVGQVLRARYQRPLAVDLHPKLTVSYGAASKAVHERARSHVSRSFPPTGPHPIVRPSPPGVPLAMNGSLPAMAAATESRTASPRHDPPPSYPPAPFGPAPAGSVPAARGAARTVGGGRTPPGAGPSPATSAGNGALPEGGSRLPGEPRRRLRRADLPLVLAAVLLLAGALAAGLYLTNRRNSSDDTTASGPSAGASASTTTTAAVPVTSPPAALSLPNKALFTQNGVSVVDAGFTSYTDATTTGSARKVSWALVVRNTLPDKTIRSATVEFQLLDVAGEEVGKGTVEVIHLAPGATSAGVSDDTEVPRKPAKLKVLAVKNVEVATPTPPTGAAQSSGVTVTAETAPNTVSASGTLVSTFGVAVKNANVSVVVENAAGNIVCGGAVTVPTIPAGQSVPYDLTFGCPVAGPYVAVAFVDIPPEAASTSTAS